MHHIFIAGFKIHNSDFIIFGAIAYAILWIINRLIRNAFQNKSHSEVPGSPAAHREVKPLTGWVKYTVWFANIIAFVFLSFMLKYLFS